MLRRVGWGWRVGLLALGFGAPLGYLVLMILTRTVDVPFADQWELVPLLQRSFRGQLTMADLWAQHNEHRLLVPRALMIWLARLSRWNTHYEMLLSVLVASATCGVLLYQLRLTGRMLGVGLLWLTPVISLAIFSLNQGESWWGGWNMQIFLHVLGVTLAVVLLTHPSQCWPALLGAIAAGLLATYSYSPGLIIWPLGVLLLLAQLRGASRRACLRLGVWLGAAGLALASFFHGYQPTAQLPPADQLLTQQSRYLSYAVTYLGAAPVRNSVEYLFGLITGDTRAICNLGDSDLCGYVNDGALASGLLALALLLLLTIALARKVGLRPLLPYLGLALYVIASAALTSLGRASYGNHQALAQRYITTTTPLWLALAAMLGLYARLARRAALRRAAGALLLLFALTMLLSTAQGPDHFDWQYEYLAPARLELRRRQNTELLARLYPNPQILLQRATVLRARRLSIYRERP